MTLRATVTYSHQLFCRSRVKILAACTFSGFFTRSTATNSTKTANYFRILLLDQLKRKMSSSGSESESSAWMEEKDKILNMPLEERRKHYYCADNYVTLKDILTWEEYVKENEDELVPPKSKAADCDPKLNKKLSVWNGDITKLEIDAIVNAANSRLAGGAGVDGAIHSGAGEYLHEECATLNGCDVGEAKLTGGYHLPAKYVIHTVGPRGERPEDLKSCYMSSLQLAISNNLRTLAFPCISTGIYGYPQEAAAKVAISSVRKFLEENSDLDRIIFCTFLDTDTTLYKKYMQKYFPTV